jgi:hypothetical protein
MLEILTVMNMPVVVIWLATPCHLAGGYQHFGGMYRLQMETLTPTHKITKA